VSMITYTYASMRVYIYICMYTSTSIHVWILPVCAHMKPCAYIYTYIYTNTHMYIHIQTYMFFQPTHTLIYTPVTCTHTHDLCYLYTHWSTVLLQPGFFQEGDVCGLCCKESYFYNINDCRCTVEKERHTEGFCDNPAPTTTPPSKQEAIEENSLNVW